MDYIGGSVLAHQQWNLTIPRIKGVHWFVLNEIVQIVSNHVNLMESNKTILYPPQKVLEVGKLQQSPSPKMFLYFLC